MSFAMDLKEIDFHHKKGPYSLIDYEIDVGKNMGTYLNNHDKEFLHAIFEKKVEVPSYCKRLDL